MPEIAEGAALLVDPYDVNAIADAMCRMSADHDTATRYSALGLARAATYDWDVEAEKVARAYRDILGTQAPA
jgi:glycosyltransferase involved in cell wall biosynthesis